MKKSEPTITRLAYTPAEAAASIGVGVDFFEDHIAPELRVVRRGRKRLIGIPELQNWLEANAEAPMSGVVARPDPRARP